MILVLGGTTEGLIAVEVLEKGCKPYYYSTLGANQEIELSRGVRISGALDGEAMARFCRDKGVGLIVDAAHPFASRLHKTAAMASRKLGVPVVRLKRRFASRDERFIWCEDYADACARLENEGVTNLLILTGANSLVGLRPFWSNHTATARILDRDESRDKAYACGFPSERIVYYSGDGDIKPLLSVLHPDAIITKESGVSGGFETKTAQALAAGTKVFVVRRPEMPDGFIQVDGPYGLRRQVERLVPGFFELRSGFTTGSCATAAACAAMTALRSGRIADEVTFVIPSGERLSMDVESVTMAGECAVATVVKDGGDDPDVTHRARISASVRLTSGSDITILGGDGIGTVTLPGLGLPVGGPAINPVPRKMIADNLRALYDGGCEVTISIEGGRELATRTFNPRVGVTGGLSVVGTTGIVMPFSHEAFIDCIRREFEVAQASDTPCVVLTSGARSERIIHGVCPDLPPQAYIHYGNSVGETLAIAEDMAIENVVIGLMIGKAVKLAEGHADTHSHKVTLNHEFLKSVAREAGCSDGCCKAIGRITLARELWSIIEPDDAALFFTALLRRCYDYCRTVYTGGALEAMLIDEAETVRYRDDGTR